MPEPLGVFGGTFDPPHLAHLALARCALDRFKLSQIVWIPALCPPHREPPRANAADRIAMVRAAIAAEPRFTLDCSTAIAGDVDQPSYMVTTLQALRQQQGEQRPLLLLLGADAFHGLHRWHRWQELFSLAHLAIATRRSYPLADLADAQLASAYRQRLAPAAALRQSAAGAIVSFALEQDVSATQGRQLLAQQAAAEQLQQLLPTAVVDYIQQHSLYRD